MNIADLMEIMDIRELRADEIIESLQRQVDNNAIRHHRGEDIILNYYVAQKPSADYGDYYIRQRLLKIQKRRKSK